MYIAYLVLFRKRVGICIYFKPFMQSGDSLESAAVSRSDLWNNCIKKGNPLCVINHGLRITSFVRLFIEDQ